MIKKGTLLLLFLGITLVNCQEKKVKKGVDLSVTEFEKQIVTPNAYLLDVRTPREVSAGVIEGAAVLDMMSSDFMEKYNTIPKDKNIYVYCRSGNRSKQVLEFLKSKGYASVYHLDGGIKAWINENKKIKK